MKLFTGIVGFVGAATYGIIKIRQNPKMNFPLMMVQLRVGSQGMFAAILMITVVGSLTKNLKEQYWDKK